MKPLWPILVILVVASGLRLYALDQIDVRFDEASAPQFALSIVNGNLLAVAPFSGSIANHPPVFLYVLAIPYLFTRDLLVVAAFRVLLDVAAIALLWILCRRHFSLPVAFAACIFFAAAPWAIQLSRKLWIVELPLFTTLLLFGLLELTNKKNSWGWAISGLGIALCVGTHLAALFLLPAALIAWVMSYKEWRTSRVIPGAIPIGILALVYILYDASHDFINLRALLVTTQTHVTFTLDSLQYAAWISGGMHLSDLTAGAYPIWQAQLPPIFDWLDVLQVALFGAGVLYVGYRLIRALLSHDACSVKVNIMLIVWILAPILLQIRHSQPVQIHYVTPMYPVPFILMALPIDALLNWSRKKTYRMRAGTVFSILLIVAFILAWQVVTTIRFTNFVMQHDTAKGGYGLPVRAAYKAAMAADEAACRDPMCQYMNTPQDVIVVAPGGDPLVNEQATIMNVLLAGVPHRFANSDSGIIIPPSASQYIFTIGSENALQLLLENIEPGRIVSRTYQVRDGYPPAYTYLRISEPVAHQYNESHPARWANGIELLGYKASLQSSVELDVYLRVLDAPVLPVDYHWYNHLLSKGVKVSQLDGGGISASNWRKGDLLIHHFSIPLPSQPLTTPITIRIGAYEYPSIKNVSVVHPDGSVDDGIDLMLQ